MTSPSNPTEVPSVDSSSGPPPPESKESIPVVAAASGAVVSTTEKATQASRNDDSNPQQGTGASRTPTKAEVAAPPPPEQLGTSMAMMPPLPQQRPSMKIPPTAKDERKLFVGGLPADITNEEFSSFFAQFGSVIDSIVMFDFETGRSRGFGFVTYEDPHVARHLLSLSRIPMRDKLVEVKAAQPKEGRSGGGGRPYTRGGGGAGRRKVAEERTPSAAAEAAVTPEAFAVAEGPTYPYGQPAYPAMPYYGYAPPPVYGAPVYGAPVYVPTPAPYPAAAGFVQGYVAPVYFPPEASGAAATAPAATPAPVMPEQQANAAATGFAGYAYIPFAPPPPPAGFPPEQK